MRVFQERSFRVLVVACFSVGIAGLASGIPLTWTVVPLSALLSAVLLPALLTGPSLVPMTAMRHGEATR